MGYITQVEGQINLTDTKQRKVFNKSFVEECTENGIEIPEHRFSSEDVYADMKNTFDVHDELHWIIGVQDTQDGYMVIYSEYGKAYEFTKQVQMVVDYFKDLGFTADGEIRMTGEESPDFSRVILRDGVAVWERAEITIVFPDGTEW